VLPPGSSFPSSVSVFFLLDPAPSPALFTLSLHDALPISLLRLRNLIERVELNLLILEHGLLGRDPGLQVERRLLVLRAPDRGDRSEEHTSELQSRRDLVCRLLLEKKNQRSWH